MNATNVDQLGRGIISTVYRSTADGGSDDDKRMLINLGEMKVT